MVTISKRLANFHRSGKNLAVADSPPGIIEGADGALLIVRATGPIIVVRSWAEIGAEANRRYPLIGRATR
jgi:hypothetical protein